MAAVNQTLVPACKTIKRLPLPEGIFGHQTHQAETTYNLCSDFG
jgi:hypothetical protein